jgi:hypothetical protein
MSARGRPGGPAHEEDALKRPVVLVFLIDALGWEIAERFGFTRGTLPVRAPLGTVLEG